MRSAFSAAGERDQRPPVRRLHRTSLMQMGIAAPGVYDVLTNGSEVGRLIVLRQAQHWFMDPRSSYFEKIRSTDRWGLRWCAPIDATFSDPRVRDDVGYISPRLRHIEVRRLRAEHAPGSSRRVDFSASHRYWVMQHGARTGYLLLRSCKGGPFEEHWYLNARREPLPFEAPGPDNPVEIAFLETTAPPPQGPPSFVGRRLIT